MSKVSVFNEWDHLEEIIVGRATNARIPCPDPGLFAVEYREYGTIENIPSGAYSDQVVEETEEDLDELVQTFQRLGVTVSRPSIVDHSVKFRTPDWESDGQYNYCPRDLFVALGTWIIEAPMTRRARYFETLLYKSILIDYLQSGARWISDPKPRLADEIYNVRQPSAFAIKDYEPIFDAANILRLGRDILYLISDTGNACGAMWLQTVLGEEYRVHTYDNIYGTEPENLEFRVATTCCKACEYIDANSSLLDDIRKRVRELGTDVICRFRRVFLANPSEKRFLSKL